MLFATLKLIYKIDEEKIIRDPDAFFEKLNKMIGRNAASIVNPRISQHIIGDHHRSHTLECIKREMKDAGIGFETYQESKQLRIFPVSNLIEKAGGLDNTDSIWKEIEKLDKDLFSQMEVPF